MFKLHRVVIRTVGIALYRINVSTSTAPKALIANHSKTDIDMKKIGGKPKNVMVAAALSLLTEDDDPSKNLSVPSSLDEIDERIVNARSVVQLLSVGENSNGLTRKHALKIVSILAEWSSIGRAKLSEFESDPRFIRLCRQLGRTVTKPKLGEHITNASKKGNFRTDDLNMVMGIAGDDEAAKLISSISVPQMIRVMSALANKKRRSTTLLRSLAYNISSNTEGLDLKQCADLLYAMAVLNFPDSVLITRAGMDIQNGLANNSDKPAVVGSIITSLGLLRYRDADLLENLSQWVLKYRDICRPQDISSLFLTLATLNYPTTRSDEIQQNLVKTILSTDFTRAADWLNHVWTLAVLGFADCHHWESVLRKEFIENLVIERKGDLLPTMKLKLLNINAAAKCIQPMYAGSMLSSNSEIFEVPLEHSKNKNILVNALGDALKNLFSSSNVIRTHHDTRMGFVIDAELMLDQKGNPLPLDQEHKTGTKVAIMIRDFHDLCQGAHQQLSGVSALAHKLLEHAGYNIVVVPYNEFSASDKLLKRVQYLEGKLKLITKKKINNKVNLDYVVHTFEI